MAEKTTELTYNSNTGRMDSREVYAKQEQGKYSREASDEDAKQGVKELFKKEAPAKPAQPPEDNSLGAAAARARKKREELAKAEGQKVALSR